MQLLYPSDPFDKSQADEAYAEEFLAAENAGLTPNLFSLEDFELGRFKPRSALAGSVLYRGWMMSPDRYAQLQKAIESRGAEALVSAEQYRYCHYLPLWYQACIDLTPRTIFLDREADISAALVGLGWSAYFVKDFVKSLTTQRGSIAKDAAEVSEIVDLIEQYRGQIEGGLCIREYEDLLPETEKRYFVFRGCPYAADDEVPEIVRDIARRIDSPFFSVDIVLNDKGEPRLVELGDGQVSDRKHWSASKLVELWRHGPGRSSEGNA